MIYRDRINATGLGLQICESAPRFVIDDQGIHLWVLGDDAMLRLWIGKDGVPYVRAYWHEGEEKVVYEPYMTAFPAEPLTKSYATTTVQLNARQATDVPER
jgi:hypothetical protein